MPSQKKNKRRVAVALSGGVDSSVSALLLKRQGFDVVGFYAKCWLPSENDKCTSDVDEKRAMMVAKQIGIPFYSLDLVEDYKERVFKYFVETYKRGETPNPDVVCNKELKFGILFDKVMGLGFDYFATGHYARKTKDGKFIKAHKDSKKDQSYFLARLDKEKISKIIFPLSDLTKKEVREIAKKEGLITSEAPESQGICFIGEVNLREFLSRYIKPQKGLVVEYETNKVLGEHQGVFYYTIGQRKDIRIPGGPYYVIKKDVNTNTLYVTKDKDKLLTNKIKFNDVYVFSENGLSGKLEAKIRSQQEFKRCEIKKDKNGFFAIFDEPQWGVAPGQVIAFYKQKKLIGSGIIE